MKLPAAHAARPWVIAHRGDSRDHPENTIRAFDSAVRGGCDAIELDLQLSRDGVPVVYHDRTLARAGGGRRRVAQSTLDELERLDAAAKFGPHRGRQRIPTLERVLARYGGRVGLLLEVKVREDPATQLELTRATVSLVRRLRLESRVLLLCFEPRVLEECAVLAPRLGRVLNLRAPRRPGPGLERRLAGLHALSVDVRTLTPAFAAGVRLSGCPLLVFTCNTARAVRQALRAGAAGIMSDRPAWLAEQVRRAEAEA